jgi:lipid-A-disaccharide synthase
LQWQANPGRITTEIISLLTDRARREKMIDDLASASRQLGPPGAAQRTAEMVLDLVAYGSHQPLLQPIGAETEG